MPLVATRAVAGPLLLALWFSAEPAAHAPPASHPQTSPPCCVTPGTAQPVVPDMRGTDQAPFAVKVTQAPVFPMAEPPKDWSGWIIAGATVWLALVTTALAIFTFRLWRSTGDLVRGAAETAERELRAYVFVKDARIEGVTAGDSPVATVPLKNSGQTPAYKVRVSVQQELRAAFVEMPAFEESKVLGHLAPGAVLTVMAPSVGSLDRSEYAGLDSGDFTLFVYGVVHYIDAFKVPHWTRFRVMVGGPAGLRAERPDGSLALVSCAEGNETDDDI